MKTKEESSFLQGIESRLDSLFGEDTQPVKEKEVQRIDEKISDPPLAAAQEIPPDIVEDDDGKIQVSEEPASATEISPSTNQTQDKSTFITEIEKRFSAIFGENEKESGVIERKSEAEEIKREIVQEEKEEIPRGIPSLSELASAPASILGSPLKDMKSIILSIEWEINDQILEQLEDEISKLYLLYTGDRVIQGLLRIIRFLGRYIRVRGFRSNQDSINLLLFVYDHLESVMVSEGMTEAKKHLILLENIQKYRNWVENTGLDTFGEQPAEETAAEALKPEEKALADEKPLELEEAVVLPAEEEKLVETLFMDEAEIVTKPEEPVVEEIPFTEEVLVDEKPPVLEEAVVLPAEEEKSIEALFLDEGAIITKPEEPMLEAAPFTEEVVAETEPLMGVAPSVEAKKFEDIEGKPIFSELELPPEKQVAEVPIEAETVEEPASFISELPVSESDRAVKEVMAAMQDMPPHEAYAYAVDSLRKTFQSELDALKEEIRILKESR